MSELRARPATAADYPTFARLFPELAVPDPLPTAAQFVERMVARVIIVDRVPRAGSVGGGGGDGDGHDDGGRNGDGDGDGHDGRDGDGDGAAGYGFFQLYGSTMHVVHVVAARYARGCGVGAAIMKELHARARTAGCTRWFLNVKQENVAAIRLYERSGMSRESEGWTLRMPWSALSALPEMSTPMNVTAYTPDEAEDVELASRFGLEIARLAALRQRPNVALVALKDDVAPCAFAAFDPAFPGVYPIRVEDPVLARPLLEELLPHAQHDYANVWVEDNRALMELLVSAGGAMQFSIFRMAATLG